MYCRVLKELVVHLDKMVPTDPEDPLDREGPPGNKDHPDLR